jgi:hypothetical protein
MRGRPAFLRRETIKSQEREAFPREGRLNRAACSLLPGARRIARRARRQKTHLNGPWLCDSAGCRAAFRLRPPVATRALPVWMASPAVLFMMPRGHGPRPRSARLVTTMRRTMPCSVSGRSLRHRPDPAGRFGSTHIQRSCAPAHTTRTRFHIRRTRCHIARTCSHIARTRGHSNRVRCSARTSRRFDAGAHLWPIPHRDRPTRLPGLALTDPPRSLQSPRSRTAW